MSSEMPDVEPNTSTDALLAMMPSDNVSTAGTAVSLPPRYPDLDLDQTLVVAIIDKVALAMVFTGAAANAVTVTTLGLNGSVFSSAILTLLRSQSAIDAWICLVTAAVLMQPNMWSTGLYHLDRLICHLWHGQATYWISAFMSIYNLVTIAFERYLAVCHPFKHKDYTRKKVYYTLGVTFVAALICIGPAFFQVRMSTTVCVPEFAIPGEIGKRFFYAYSILIFFIIYIIPCTLFVLLYGMVILAFRRRQSEGQFGTTRVIDKATTDLTRTAVVVTIIFILTLGYELWYFMLGYTGVLYYKKNTIWQKMGLLFTTFNSVCNPFVYALLMPAYRHSLAKTFCGTWKRNNSEAASISSAASTAA